MTILNPTYPTAGADRGTEEVDVLNVLLLLVGDYNGNITNANVKADAAIALSKLGTTGALFATSLTLTGTLNVTGAVTFNTTLNVTGAVQISSTLLVLGKIVANGDQDVNGAFQSPTITGTNITATNTITAANGIARGGKQVIVGEEKLRTIRGAVDSAGVTQHGSGFTSSRAGVGVYVVTFTAAFTAGATPQVTPNAASPRFIGVGSPSATQIVVSTWNSAGAAVDCDFYFTVVGLIA